MTTKLSKLEFLIGVKDGASSKIARLQKQMESMAKRVQGHFASIGMGAAGMVGAGFSIKAILNPAIEMQRALNSLSSVGAEQDALDILSSKAKNFAKTYGGSATDIVNASYSMQGAITGLHGAELGTFTIASATLAKGTKGDVEVISDYMGTMYGVFKEQADVDKIGWIENLTGKSAYAIQQFKSDGNKLAAAFTSLGSMAQAQGISMDEQFAIMGELQASMGGAESGTKYKAFLRGVAQAQEGLGLNFADSNGKMLSAVEIMEKIKRKFGHLDMNELALIKKAFGSDEASAFISNLIGKTDTIKGHIEGLGKVKGLGYAEDMAKQVTDVWERFGGVVDAASITFGSKMLPTLEKGVDKLAALIDYLDWLMEFCPHLTKYVGLFTIAVILAGAAMGALAIASGVSQLAFMGISGPVKTFIKLMAWLRKTTIAQTVAQWAANAAMWANPIGIIILAVVGLIAVVGTLIYFWDDIRAYLGETSWGQRLLAALDWLGIGFGSVKEAGLSLLKLVFFPLFLLAKGIETVWGALSEKLANVSWTDVLITALKAVAGPLGFLLDGLGLIAKAAGIELPGMGLSPAMLGQTAAPAAPTLQALRAVSTMQVPQGGILGQARSIISNTTSTQGSSVTIGEQNFFMEQPLSPDQMEAYAVMRAR